MPRVSVGSVAATRLGKMLDRAKNRGTPRRYLRNLNVRWEDFDLSDVLEMPFEADEIDEFTVRVGDVLVCEGGEPGRAAVWDDREPGLLFQKAIHRVRFTSPVNPRYFTLALRQASDCGRILEYSTGITFKHLTGVGLRRFTFPLPDIGAQGAIVEIVDELMQLCDELEAAQSKRDETRDRLRAASLARLTATTDMPGIVDQKDVTFFLSQSDRTVTKPEHVADLRRTVMRCAVQGLLTAASSPRTTTDELLAGIDAERAEVARSDRRASPNRKVILAPELMWTVPEHWSWRALADLALFIDYRGKTPEKVSAGVRLVTAKNVRPGKINSEPGEFISEGEYSKWMTRGLPRQGDILFTTEAPMGNAAVVDTDERFALAQRIIDLRVYGKTVPAFAALILNAEPFQRILDATATGLTAKGIKSAKLQRLPIPIPPVDEQLSVVARVDELMTVCDEFEYALQAAEDGRAKLLEAVLHEALNGRGVDAQLTEATV